MNQNQPFYEPQRANSFFNSGTGRYHNRPNGNLAPEWDGNPDSVPPGYGVIRVEAGAMGHETREVSVFVNGFQVTIPRGSARIVSEIHINRLVECCWETDYNQVQYYQRPQGIRRPRFPVSIIVQPKASPVLIDETTGYAAKAEAKEIKRTTKRNAPKNTDKLIDGIEDIEL